MVSRDTSADAMEAMLRDRAEQRDGGKDYSLGVPRRDCPLVPPGSPAALSWLAEWDAAAERAARLMQEPEKRAAINVDAVRDTLHQVKQHLIDLQYAKSITAHGAKHRQVQNRVVDVLASLPPAKTGASQS